MIHSINSSMDYNIPETTTVLIINSLTENIKIPDSVSSIVIRFGGAISLDQIDLPESLTTLTVDFLKDPLLNLPISLQKLDIKYYNEDIFNRCKIPFGCEVILGTNVFK